MRRFILAAFAAMTVVCAGAQTCKDDFKKDAYNAGSNYVAYPGPQKALTPSPKGYEPYYLSHYGRHGSRYHIGSHYTDGYAVFAKADSAGVLTEKGKKVMAMVKEQMLDAAGRDGELSPLGAQQHRQIAERMYRNFPEIFAKETNIDAKSTIVIRCILSMENALQQLSALNPKLHITHDASHHDMYYMNQSDSVCYKAKRKHRKLINEYGDANNHPERLMRELFTSDSFWQNDINAKKFFKNLFQLAMNLQSLELRHTQDMRDLFTQEEMYDLWKGQNAYWYVYYGPSSYSDGIQPYSQRNLLNKIISEADSCLVLDNPGATLRYGHDTMVMPLTCLLELDDTNRDIKDFDELPMKEWCDYRIFPMACNIQFVFYRPVKGKKGDILVKVLRNENEAKLPVSTDNWPYYKWNDVRAYYKAKLDKYAAVRGEK